jgi:2-acylglycerol O-acyltransferase 2
MRNYFPQRVHIPKDFPALKAPADGGKDQQQYLFALHPHGSMSEFRIMLDGQLLKLLPGLQSKQVCWLSASVLFRLPIAREFCLWTGCVDAGRKTAEKMLEAGHSVGVIPGGEHEQLITEYGKDLVYIKKRYGFVKLAMRFGVPLVPCYVFGCSDLYYTSKFLIGLRMALVKNLGVAVPLCFGAYGLPAAPFKRPLDIVIGQPIYFDRCPEPTNEQVIEAHQKYMDALQALFDKHKAEFGYGDRVLQLQ